MAAEAGGETRCGIGSRLKSARERKGLTILQAAEKLHVDAKIIESLEAEDFAALGAPVYVRGHLRHYAELIGEPVAELQGLYSASIQPPQPDLTRVPNVRPAEDPRKLVVPALVVLVGFAVVGGVWWVMSLYGEHPPAVQSHTAAAVPAAAGNATPGETDEAATAMQAVKAVAKGEGAVAGGSPNTAGKQTAPRAQQPAPAAGEGSAPPRAAPRQAELTLKFSAESWAEVYDASGQRLFYDVGAADSVRTMKGAQPLRVVLGNAAGVAVEVNGRPAAIEPAVRPDGSARFAVHTAGRAVRVKPLADGG